jgi:hypothetical protein
LVEVLVNVFQKCSLVQLIVVATSFQIELVTIIEKHEPIIVGAELAIVSCTLPLPIEHVEVLVVVFSIHV